MIGALARIGGVVVHPRATLVSILRGQGGGIFEILPWFLLVAMTVAPRSAGQAILVGRTNPLDGIRLLLGLLTNRTGGPMVGAVIGALLLVAADRFQRGRDHAEPSKQSLGFDRSLDACLYCLVPFLLLASTGAALSALGAELWFMPHRLLRGRGWFFATRLLVGYGWSVALFVALARDVLRGAADDATAEG